MIEQLDKLIQIKTKNNKNKPSKIKNWKNKDKI